MKAGQTFTIEPMINAGKSFERSYHFLALSQIDSTILTSVIFK